ncbi:MAG: DUF1344 domain-containing protein [Candidatus Tokpelaia sp.]|uniref:DUF1344 domain-containing protein n=1 Tax=Candidatus Tokpelaia sp. TaxID=2233777 RepID=UPI00123A83AE|nr:DUF1344 domain-containing protein [Candidatus Tokpelaia sp.]KAA6204763.1 MAG: DUF1344 domain-containing protein [Candidatus Tokpelaia sp.]KAA6206755.1 MAG: DUF1344 domain-containing protein [Candidatus Tokpelaia sp.]KAA6405331.1 hypothetical protein DPQ22_05410 [Candidatus Tokpelaia sp.]
MPFTFFLQHFARRLARFAGCSLTAAVLSIGFAAAALADSADGTITRIDESDNSLTLNNGRLYKLPGEFDYSNFRVGQKVSVFYDTDPSGSYITDIEVQGKPAADTDPAENNETVNNNGEADDSER